MIGKIMSEKEWEPQDKTLRLCPYCKGYFCGTDKYEENVQYEESTKTIVYQSSCYECGAAGPITKSEKMANRAFFGHPIVQLWRVFWREFPDCLGKIITWDIDYRRFYDIKSFYGIKISRVLTIEESLTLWVKDKFSK